LLRELSDDEEDAATDTGLDVPDDPQRPWLRDYHAYVDVLEQVPEGWTAIQWWGVSIPDWIFGQVTNSRLQYNSQRYHPAWGSLAQDYLAIMSLSVSSERAFSQGGITISKRRSRLKGDIVEALQCIKCAVRHDLLFRECAPSSILEAEETSDQELEVAGARGDLGGIEELDVEELSWVGLLIEEDDDNDTMY
jgi:hAT family C-terminal dimerisation region